MKPTALGSAPSEASSRYSPDICFVLILVDRGWWAARWSIGVRGMSGRTAASQHMYLIASLRISASASARGLIVLPEKNAACSTVIGVRITKVRWRIG